MTDQRSAPVRTANRFRSESGSVGMAPAPAPRRRSRLRLAPAAPLAALKYLLSLAFLGSVLVPFGTLAALSWLYLHPALERCAELRADWILQTYARNLGLMLLVAGGLHLYFYTFRRQGARAEVRPARHGHERPQVLRAQPGPGQHALDLRERRDDMDGL